MSGKATVHVKTVRRRTMNEIIGFRIEAAVPNQEGRVMKPIGDGDFYATKEHATSYRRPYFIAESSDHSWIDKKTMERFLSDLRWRGYDKFEFEGKYEGEPLAALMLLE